MNTATLTHEIRNGGDTKLVVSVGTWRKKGYVDIRNYWRSPDGEWHPTKRGVRVSAEDGGVVAGTIRNLIGELWPVETGDTPEQPKNGKKQDDSAAKEPCAVCGQPVTWFHFDNIWRDGEIIGRVHIRCQKAVWGASDTMQAWCEPETGVSMDLSALSVIGEIAEHLNIAECTDLGKKYRDGISETFAVKMAERFKAPDAPHTAYFDPLQRPKGDAQIEKIRAGSKPRRHPLGDWFGCIWDIGAVATAQHPNHPHGASYCTKCQPYSLKRMQAIAQRAQECIDAGVNRDPLPPDAFAWRRELDTQYSRANEASRKRYGKLA